MVTDLPFIVNRGSDLFTMTLLLFERASGGKQTKQTEAPNVERDAAFPERPIRRGGDRIRTSRLGHFGGDHSFGQERRHSAGQRLQHHPARVLDRQAPSDTGSVSADGYCAEW